MGWAVHRTPPTSARRRAAADDLGGGEDASIARHAAAGLPEVLERGRPRARPRFSWRRRAQRRRRCASSAWCGGRAAASAPIGPALVPRRCDVGRVDHRDRHAGDPLGQHDVVVARPRRSPACSRAWARHSCGGDEARAHLHAGVAQRRARARSPARRPRRRRRPAARRGRRSSSSSSLRAAPPGVPAGAAVDGDQPVDAGVERLLAPSAARSRRGRRRRPAACARSTTQRGLPSAVTKKRIPSSSAIVDPALHPLVRRRADALSRPARCSPTGRGGQLADAGAARRGTRAPCT